MSRALRNPVRDLEQLIALWDMHSDRTFEVKRERHGTNVALVSAYVNHSVNLARGVLAMHKIGLNFESISLVRSTMECAVTASWHVLFPDKTPDFIRHSAKERKKILQTIIDKGYSDDTAAIRQVDRMLSEEHGPIDPEGRWLSSRFKAIAGGDQLYTIYRVLCTWDHATNSLADNYTEIVQQSEKNPWGIRLLTKPVESTSTVHWVATEASLVLRAQIAFDKMLEKPRHKTQLATWAKKMKVAGDIQPASEEQ